MASLVVQDSEATRSCLEERFHSLERFFAFLLLRHSAHESCLKLLVRCCDGAPYLLVWLMEPILLFADGRMKETALEKDVAKAQEGKKPSQRRKKALSDSSLINACTAVKLLYRVFDGAGQSG